LLGIIILNYNSCKSTVECVESILRTTNVEFKIYLVDNNSSDDSVSTFNEKFGSEENIKIINSNYNGGYSVGNNMGIREALKDGVENLLITNSDIIFYEGSIDNIDITLKNNYDIAVASPKIKNLDGSFENSFLSDLNFYEYFYWKLIPQKRLNKIKFNKANIKINKEKNFISYDGMNSGCCFAIRSSVFNNLGLFDEKVFLYYEELILANKLIVNGYKSVIINDAVVLHKHEKSRENSLSSLGAMSVSHSLLYYMRKYKKINIVQWFIIFLFHFARYFKRSLYKDDYRKNLKLFLYKSISTLK
jgi:GT2 family glycosyltransferase